MDTDLPSSLSSFADQLQDTIDALSAAGDDRRATACGDAQSGLRSAAALISAVDLLEAFESRQAADAVAALRAATQTLDANAQRIARLEKDVKAAAAIAAGAAQVAAALTPFRLPVIAQGLAAIRSSAAPA